MPKFQPWLKMWVEWIDDLKMLSLSLAEQGAWWRLVTLAKKCAADGFLIKGKGAPLSLDEIANTLRIKVKADRKVFDSMIEKMTDLGSLHWDSHALVITHFAERQAKTSSEAPEAVRDRVRRFRERQKLLDKEALKETARQHQLQSPPITEETTPEELGQEISSLLLQLANPTHGDIKNTLANLALAKRLLPKPEAITNIGRIDLLWQTLSDETIAGFEIDMRRLKPMSRIKLKALHLRFPFVILPAAPQGFQTMQGFFLIGLAKSVTEKPLHPLTTPTTVKERDIDTVVDVEGNAVTSVTPEAILSEIANLHEENFGIITPLLAEKFKDFAENYRGPIEWIKEAFAEAVTNNVRKWAYVEKILDTWQSEGRKTHGRRASPGRGAPAHKQDPHAAAKAKGWKVGGEEDE
ncbi:hypothetical protein ES703_85903 [subsurface metagenome]